MNTPIYNQLVREYGDPIQPSTRLHRMLHRIINHLRKLGVEL